MRVCCPSCHDSIDVDHDAALSDLVCPSCDSKFSLLGEEETLSLRQPKARSIGHFQLVETLGVGGFGTVWKARDTKLDRIVAVKIPRKGQLDSTESEQFFREARAAAQLKHPNIVTVHEVGREGESIYIVSDFINGVSLADQLTDQTLNIKDAARLCSRIAGALEHAHRAGVIHRDLKPSNIMLDENREPHLMDFGLAKREAGEITMTYDGKVLGTPAYMSPEQAMGDAHNADRRSDIYSLGVILFELLTGERPFRGNARMLLHHVIHDDAPSPKSLNGSVPQDLDTVCVRCLEKDPEKRLQTAADFRDELERFINGQPIRSRPISSFERAFRLAKRNPVVASLAVAIMLLLLVGLSSVTGLWLRAEHNASEAQRQRASAQENLGKALVAEAENKELADAEREARAQTEYSRYILQINLAAANLDQGNTMVAQRALLATPPKYRNWEWGHLVSRAWPSTAKTGLDAIPQRQPELSTAEFWSTDSIRVIPLLDHGRHLRLNTLEFSNDGLKVVTGASDGTVHIWDLQTNEPEDIPVHNSIITANVFDPLDLNLAVGDVSGTLALLNMDTRKALWTISFPDQRNLSSIWFSQDGEHLVVADVLGNLHVLESTSGELIHTFNKHDKTCDSVEFLSNGRELMSASIDGTIRVWELETGRETQDPRTVPPYDGRGLAKHAISPSLKQSAMGYSDGSIFLWDLETGHKTELSRSSIGVKRLAFSHDGTCLFVAEGERTVRVWNTKTGEQLQAFTNPLAEASVLKVGPADNLIMTFSGDGVCTLSIPVDEVADETRSLSNAHSDIVLQASFSADSRRIVTASYDKTVSIWDAASQQLLQTFTGHEHELLKAEFSHDGDRVASVSVLGTLRVWDAQTAQEKFVLSADEDSFGRAAAFGGRIRGEILNFSAVFSSTPFVPKQSKLVANVGSEMVVADSRSGETLVTLEDNPGIGWPVVGPFGKRVATITDKLRDVHVWNLQNGRRPYAPLSGHENAADWAEFSRDGTRLVTSSMDHTAIIWNLEDGSQITRLVGHEANLLIARFSPDGKRIATASADGTARIWDAVSGETLSTFAGHSGRLSNVEFSPDGRRLLTTGLDNMVRIWEAEEVEARELLRINPTSKLTYGTWSPDGRKVLTCWADGSVKLLSSFPWKATTHADLSLEERVHLWHDGMLQEPN